jgi:hypothetical protein
VWQGVLDQSMKAKTEAKANNDGHEDSPDSRVSYSRFDPA